MKMEAMDDVRVTVDGKERILLDKYMVVYNENTFKASYKDHTISVWKTGSKEYYYNVTDADDISKSDGPIQHDNMEQAIQRIMSINLFS